jgi:hypothetical protein
VLVWGPCGNNNNNNNNSGKPEQQRCVFIFCQRREVVTIMNSNNNKSILIVNDVQDFNAGGVYCKNYEPLAKIEELIDFAKENGDYIFVVRYPTPACGPIHPRILRRLAGYANWRMVKKAADFNGAKWIIEMACEMGISMKRFIMSGFETHSCVQSTTRGLKVRLPNCQIEVIKALAMIKTAIAGALFQNCRVWCFSTCKRQFNYAKRETCGQP